MSDEFDWLRAAAPEAFHERSGSPSTGDEFDWLRQAAPEAFQPGRQAPNAAAPLHIGQPGPSGATAAQQGVPNLGGPWNHQIGPGAPPINMDPSQQGFELPAIYPLTPEETDAAKANMISHRIGVKPSSSTQMEGVNDVVRSIASGITLGGADRIAAGLGAATGIGGQQGGYAGNLAAEQAKTDQFRREHPWVSAGAAALGTLGGAAVLPEFALPAGAGARLAAGVGIGGVVGGIQGFNESPDWTNASDTAARALKDAGVGAVAGGAAPIVAGGLRKLAGAVLPKAAAVEGAPPAVVAPTVENIERLKNEAYQKVDTLGAAYTPEAYGGLVDKIIADARDARINPALNPKATAAIEEMQNFRNTLAQRGTPLSLTELDQIRQFVNRNVTSSPEASEKFFGRKIAGHIDEFVANSGSEHMAAGSAPEAASAIREARDLNTRYEKTRTLQTAMEDAKLQAGATGSGGNIDNVIRQKLRSVFKKGRNWTPEETTAFKQAIEGASGQDLLRMMGKFSPTSGGLTAMLEIGLGSAMGGLGVPAAAIGGLAAKTLADRSTKGAAQKIAETILAGPGGPITTKFGKFPRTRAGARALAAAMSASGRAAAGSAAVTGLGDDREP